MIRAKCKGCGQAIGFVETAKGKRMPIDPDLLMTKTERDIVMVEVNEDGRKFYRAERGTLGLLGYRAHFATCENIKRRGNIL